MILHLSELPPPLSACFKNNAKHGRVKTARYKSWITLATVEIWQQWMRRKENIITVPVSVTYRLVCPDNRKRDLGNLEKGLSDILVSTEIIKDDSLIRDLRLVWVKSENAVSIHIKDL